MSVKRDDIRSITNSSNIKVKLPIMKASYSLSIIFVLYC